jgi:hypothetical protein
VLPTSPTKGKAVASDAVHVHPRGDVIAHELTDACPCGPRTEPVKRDDGSMGWLIVHASLDGRELAEV